MKSFAETYHHHDIYDNFSSSSLSFLLRWFFENSHSQLHHHQTSSPRLQRIARCSFCLEKEEWSCQIVSRSCSISRSQFCKRVSQNNIILRIHSVSEDLFGLAIIDKVTAFANAQSLTRRISIVLSHSLITRHRIAVARSLFIFAQNVSSLLSLIIDRTIFDRLLREWKNKKRMMKREIERLRKKNAMLTKKTEDFEKRIKRLKRKIEELKQKMMKLKKKKKRRRELNLIANDIFK